LEEVWPFTGEMFLPAEYENSFLNTQVSVNVSDIRNSWNSKVKLVLEEATLEYPENKNTWMNTGGKNGVHTEHLGYMLAEMQFLQRAYPGCEW